MSIEEKEKAAATQINTDPSNNAEQRRGNK